jgi:2-haloalkanoic acid dehalogenase type II
VWGIGYGGPLTISKKIKAVLFDLDGTLRHNRPSAVDTFFDYAVQLGLENSGENRIRATRWAHYYFAQSAELVSDMGMYPDEDDFWRNYARRSLESYGCSSELAKELAPRVHQYMKDMYQPEDWVPPDVPETLEELRAAGYRLAMLSNRTNPYDEQLEALGLESYFEFAIAAGVVDSWKPDVVVFQHAVRNYGIPPGEILYVGDNYYADVIGAENAGLVPVLVDPEGVFPDAGCMVIREMGELPDLLGKYQP